MSISALTTGFSNWFFLTIVVGIPLVGYFRKVRVYDAFTEGAKESFQICLEIMPHLVGMLVAISMLRASGAFDLIGKFLAPFMTKIGMPADALPLALIRPFSGSGATAMMAEIINTHGGNAFVSQVAGTMMGSTETTFYVLAVYFGVVHIRRVRHAIWAGLIADTVGILSAVWFCRLLLN